MPVTTYTSISGVIVHEDRNGTQRNYRPDTLGNTVALTDASSATDTMSYWPYGEIRTRTGTNTTRFLFVGTLGYYTSSGRIYVRARHYKPSLGRWMTVDPRWPAQRAYLYSNLRPNLLTDPSGRSADRYDPIYDPNPNPLAFGYGNCCGLNRRCNSCDALEGGAGIDCVDKQCAIHDECLAGPLNYAFQQKVCDLLLCELVLKCLRSGGCESSPYPDACESAGWAIAGFYCSLGSALPPSPFDFPPFWKPPIPSEPPITYPPGDTPPSNNPCVGYAFFYCVDHPGPNCFQEALTNCLGGLRSV